MHDLTPSILVIRTFNVMHRLTLLFCSCEEINPSLEDLARNVHDACKYVIDNV